MTRATALKSLFHRFAGLGRCLCLAMALPVGASADKVRADQEAEMFPVAAVRLLDSPFKKAVEANRTYLLELDPDRLLAPFLREAGLSPKAPPYGNWESSGLDGHTAGHYLSALSYMIAAGEDTPDGELGRRLDTMLVELVRCQEAAGDGYLGGIPGSRTLWGEVASGNVGAVWDKWVPWYNVHKIFAGLRDAYEVAGREQARNILVGLGDWCLTVTGGLTDEQMQDMIRQEYGGMNESLADIYVLIGDGRYLQAARRFNHLSLFDPLIRHEDHLTGMHANTQIPKIIGMQRIAALTGDALHHSGARFFWETVTRHRCVAFGGNSVREHFNDVNDFQEMLLDREGPESCNTYNMLRLTEQLFAAEPLPEYADFYERALYNHILSLIDPQDPGYVYFTPIRPEHYRVYSTPDQCFWCCVGTGMENPGRYGAFIYAREDDNLLVNLFVPSELTVSENVTLKQETGFPFEESTTLALGLVEPSTFALKIRHPSWVAEKDFSVRVNGECVPLESAPSGWAVVEREWHDGDIVEVALPMQIRVELLPDESNWAAILYGPIVLASPAGRQDLVGIRADNSRMGHVAHGPLIPFDRVPVLLTTKEDLPGHVVPDAEAGPLHFRLLDVVEPATPGGRPLVPFFNLHNERYQMYWKLTTAEAVAAGNEALIAAGRAEARREAATLDRVAPGEQQPEVEHDFEGEETKQGLHKGRHWRDGKWFQYTLDSQGNSSVDLVVTYWGGDSGRAFDIFANGTRIASQELEAPHPGEFFDVRYPVPAEILSHSTEGRIQIRFVATEWVAGGVFDVRLMERDPDKSE